MQCWSCLFSVQTQIICCPCQFVHKIKLFVALCVLCVCVCVCVCARTRSHAITVLCFKHFCVQMFLGLDCGPNVKLQVQPQDILFRKKVCGVHFEKKWLQLLSLITLQIQFREKVLWTAITLFIFLICCQVCLAKGLSLSIWMIWSLSKTGLGGCSYLWFRDQIVTLTVLTICCSVLQSDPT